MQMIQLRILPHHSGVRVREALGLFVDDAASAQLKNACDGSASVTGRQNEYRASW
jgi:hypothetical protein